MSGKRARQLKRRLLRSAARKARRAYTRRNHPALTSVTEPSARSWRTLARWWVEDEARLRRLIAGVQW